MPGSVLPLRSLSAFEAAARLGSFREAAEELALTPSAISHQIRQLESRLGVQLFERSGRGVHLSHEGQRLYDHVGEGFDKLRGAMRSLGREGRSTRGREVVRVSTPPSLASQWLLPRLEGFIATYPSIDIRVVAQAGRGVDMSRTDLAILYGGAGRWQTQSVALLEERVQPLCAPALALGGKISVPGDLGGHTLIRTRGNMLSWEEWLARHAVSAGRLKSIQLDPSHMAIEAATRGLGVVLESDVLTEAERASGELVAPLPGFAVALVSYALVTPRDPPIRESIGIVRSWLLESAAARRA